MKLAYCGYRNKEPSNKRRTSRNVYSNNRTKIQRQHFYKHTMLLVHVSAYNGHLQGGERPKLISQTQPTVLITHKYQRHISDMFRYNCTAFREHKVPVLKPTASDTLLFKRFLLKRCTSWTFRVVRFLPRTIVCTYSFYKEAPEDGPLRSETCRADT